LTRYAGLVEYDGSGFAGWAAQPALRTVEGTLSEALETVLRQPVKLSVAGRTDAGVHASGQVVSFEAQTELEPSVLAYKATAVLPEDVALRRCVAVDDGFDARKSARSRSYEYRVVNAPVRSPLRRRRAIYVARELDPYLLQSAARLVRGTHDFRAFTPSKTYHVRFERVVTESFWVQSGDLLVYGITADSFLYGMVRTLVGTMLEVADGGRKMASFERLLSGGDRSVAGPALASRGLTLVGVGYKEVNFEGGRLGAE
jgi:tRNA pseudouridine38-40 synthase